MLYGPGDRVIVRSDLSQGAVYYMENGDDMNSVVHDMLPFAGKEVEIEAIAYKQYKLVGAPCYWTDGMFEGLAESCKLTKPSDEELAELLSF